LRNCSDTNQTVCYDPLSGIQIIVICFHTTDQHLLKASFQNVPVHNGNQCNPNYLLHRMSHPAFTLHGYFFLIADRVGNAPFNSERTKLLNSAFRQFFTKPMYVTKVFTHNAEIEWHTDQVARVTPQNIFHVFNGFNIHSIISCPWL